MLVLFLLSLVLPVAIPTQISNDTYQIPEDWKGCWVNPSDLSDLTFGCSGPVGGPDDSNLPPPDNATITITQTNGTEIELKVFKNGTVNIIN